MSTFETIYLMLLFGMLVIEILKFDKDDEKKK